MIKLNSTPIQILKEFDPPPLLETVYVKYSQRGMDTFHPYITDVIDYMFSLITEKKEYQYIFVRVDNFKKGDPTFHELWHVDGLLNGGQYDNFLFVSEEPTEFMINECGVAEQRTMERFDKEIQKLNPEIFKIPVRTVIKYDGYAVHRGVRVNKTCQRILIRVQNTDMKFQRRTENYETHKIRRVDRSKVF